MRHWLTTYNAGEPPVGRLCDCPIGEDHNSRGELVEPTYDDDAERAREEVDE